MLKQQLTGLSESEHEKPIFLKADKSVPYGLVVAVMADIKESGFDRLGMITQPADNKDR
jgi:biopolymer transport protein TolR